MSINISIINCRICMMYDSSMIYFKMDTKLLPPSGLSPKNVLIKYLPEMEKYITDHDFICSDCSHALRTTHCFLTKCDKFLNEQKQFILDTDFLEIKEEIAEEDNVVNYNCYSPQTTNNVLPVEEVHQPELVLVNEADIEIEKEEIDIKLLQEDVNEIMVENKDDNDVIVPNEGVELNNAVKIKKTPKKRTKEGSNSVKNKPTNLDGTKPKLRRKRVKKKVEVLEKFVCKTCEKGFEEKTELDKHMMEECKCHCNDCDITFDIAEDYKEHLKVHLPAYNCTICGKIFHNKNSAQMHERNHEATPFYVCEICGQTLRKGSNISTHMYLKHKKGDPKHKCTICSKQFLWANRLKMHMISHSTEKKVMCELCGNSFKSVSVLRSHKLAVHSGVKNFKCSLCDRSFNRKFNLNNHMKTHLHDRGVSRWSRISTPEDPLKCDVCNKVFREFKQLYMHQRIHVKRTLKCSFCNLWFKDKNILQKHEKTHVEGMQRCPICWLQFATEEELTIHSKKHANRPLKHKCKHCEDRFARKYLLENHVLLVHSSNQSEVTVTTGVTEKESNVVEDNDC